MANEYRVTQGVFYYPDASKNFPPGSTKPRRFLLKTTLILPLIIFTFAASAQVHFTYHWQQVVFIFKNKIGERRLRVIVSGRITYSSTEGGAKKILGFTKAN